MVDCFITTVVRAEQRHVLLLTFRKPWRGDVTTSMPLSSFYWRVVELWQFLRSKGSIVVTWSPVTTVSSQLTVDGIMVLVTREFGSCDTCALFPLEPPIHLTIKSALVRALHLNILTFRAHLYHEVCMCMESA